MIYYQLMVVGVEEKPHLKIGAKGVVSTKDHS